jgi:tetratricopeptide (TPR) repeat protein
VPQKTLERPADASRFWFRETRREMRQYPGRAAANLGRKALAFFSAREFRNNIGFDFVQALGWPLRLPFVQFGLLLPLAAWGLVSLRSDRSQAARLTGNLCLAWVGGYFLGGVVYFVTDRYRMPAVPLLVVSAAYGVVSLVDAFRQRRHDAILKATFVVIASGVVIWPGWFGDARSGWADDYITLGNSLREAGDTSGAARAYRQAVSMSPRNADACFHVGQLLADKPRDAIPWLERARGASPDSPDVLLELAKAYSTLGFSPKARETLEHLVGLGDRCNLWPRRAAWATAHVLLAPLDPTEADRHWQRAWDIDPRTAAEISFLYHRDINRVVSTFESLAGENPWDWYSQANYGLSLLAAGRPDDAEAPLRRAARLAPEREALRFHLARALLLAGKRDEAVAILDALARTLPDCDLKPQVDRALAEAKANPTPGR